jgi:hypothetical protein
MVCYMIALLLMEGDEQSEDCSHIDLLLFFLVQQTLWTFHK